MKNRFYRIGWVQTKNVNCGKYTLGVGVDPYWRGMIEIRIYLIWWQMPIFVDLNEKIL